jgi:hypothetical protein
MVKLVQIWSKTIGRWPAPQPYDSAAALLTDPGPTEAGMTNADLKDDEFDANDPEIPEFLRERKKERQRENEAKLEFERRESAAEKKDHEKEEKERRMHEWLASERYRRAFAQLCDDIADARRATQLACDRAREDEIRARQALEEARRNALTVSGNRVYFTRDGSRLYGEDGTEITDRAKIADASGQRHDRPDATTYEDYRAKQQSELEAIRNAEQLRNALGRLDDLGDRVKRGNLSPEELAQAEKEKQDLIDSLPSDVREDYEQRKAVRNQSDAEYRSAADLYTRTDSFQKAPDASGHFDDAVAGRAAHPTQPPTSEPGNKPVSQSTDDYRQGF